jgi:carotenoid 1,2-hydratase
MLSMDFGSPVLPGGYSWWYFDAISDDGERALTAIFFIGSVFSPDYAARIRAGAAARAEEHLGVNLALYQRGKKAAWVMSEYSAAALKRADDGGLTIGESSIESGIRTRVQIRERSAPFLLSLARVGGRVEGEIELEPLAPPLPEPTVLDGAAGHRWIVPIPRARVKVRFKKPGFEFDGTGYHDMNRGDGRLEAAFSRWSWARFHAPGKEGRTIVLYAARTVSGQRRSLIVDARDGAPPSERVARVVEARLGDERKAGWGLTLPEWFELGPLRATPESLVESSPFYARYLGALSENGAPIARGVGEHLDLDRFRARGIQFLLRFKTRRTA